MPGILSTTDVRKKLCDLIFYNYRILIMGITDIAVNIHKPG